MTDIAFLGLGEMGSALVRSAAAAGHPSIVWNRTPDKATALADVARVAATPAAVIAEADVVVVCLFDAASVHQVLKPVAELLHGKALVNLTTTSPEGSRTLADWAAGHGIGYLDGGIMAVPATVGTPGASVLYSGSRAVFEAHRQLFETWGAAEYFGEDAGSAALYDLALLSGMYVMFAGFFHGAAMVAPAGMSASAFATRATDWLKFTADALGDFAEVIDGGDYAVPGQQSLEFSDITDIVEASRAQGISTEVVDVVQGLIQRQIDAGHGKDGFARVIESIRG